MGQSRKKILRQSYKELRASVQKAINSADPIGLIANGSPRDEYDPEIGTILPRLQDADSVEQIATVLLEEFRRWFGEDEVGTQQDYSDAAKEILYALNKYREVLIS